MNQLTFPQNHQHHRAASAQAGQATLRGGGVRVGQGVEADGPIPNGSEGKGEFVPGFDVYTYSHDIAL